MAGATMLEKDIKAATCRNKSNISLTVIAQRS